MLPGLQGAFDAEALDLVIQVPEQRIPELQIPTVIRAMLLDQVPPSLGMGAQLEKRPLLLIRVSPLDDRLLVCVPALRALNRTKLPLRSAQDGQTEANVCPHGT